MLSPLEAYNRWAATYFVERNPIKDFSDEFILASIKAVEGKDVLDAGCGAGKICKHLIAQGARSVQGIDLSPSMIEQAMRHCPQAKFSVEDLSEAFLPVGSYDLVVCGLVLGHIEEFESVLSKLVGALREGGQLILTDFHPEQTKANAKRTFKDVDGKTFEVRHTLHTLEEYRSLLSHLGVESLQWQEPTFRGVPVIFGVTGVKV